MRTQIIAKSVGEIMESDYKSSLIFAAANLNDLFEEEGVEWETGENKSSEFEVDFVDLMDVIGEKIRFEGFVQIDGEKIAYTYNKHTRREAEELLTHSEKTTILLETISYRDYK